MYLPLKIIISCFLLASFLQSGCSYHNQYPENWANLNQDKDNVCTDISGVYFNLASESTTTRLFYNEYVGSNCLLTEIFSEEQENQRSITIQDIEANGIVVIQQPSSDRIVIKLYATDKMLYEHSFNGVECDNEGIKIKQPIKWEGPNDGLPAIATENKKLFFKKAADGSLVLKEKISTTGIAVVLPVYTSGTHWYKWLPAKIP
jgi:hypothetical protein